MKKAFIDLIGLETILSAPRHEFKRGQEIYHQGQVPRGMYWIENGLVGLTILGALSGKMHLLRFFREGQFFGHRSVFAEENHHGDAVALEPTGLRFLSKELILRKIQEKPELLMAIIKVLSKELRRREQLHVLMLENDVRGRVAQALIYLKNIQPNRDWTRQEIANFCGSTVSTVIKTLAQMEEDRLIQQEGRHIKIINHDELLRESGMD